MENNLPKATEPYYLCNYCKTYNPFWGERKVVMEMQNTKSEVVHCWFCGKAHEIETK